VVGFWPNFFDGHTERSRLDREQRRIAREIQDGLGQQMSGLSLLASGLAGKYADHDPKLAHDLQQLAELASRGVTTCRLLARGLAPFQEHENSLADALRRLAADSSGLAGGTKVIFSEATSAASLISQETNTHLYRIAQEALNNALKHSGAHLVQIQLRISSRKVSLLVRDDGSGIGILLLSPRGMGLQTMQDRAAVIDGRLSVSPNEPSGTVIGCECRNRMRPVSVL
jgi:signal transduction histidine kinase